MRSTNYVLVILFVLMATYAFTANQGPEKISIDGGNRGNIELPHHEHQNNLQDCTQCHNLFPQKSGGIKQKQSNGDLEKKQVMDACIGCHKTYKKEGKKYGPTKCNDCHVK